MRRKLAGMLAVLLSLGFPADSEAYLKFVVDLNGRPVALTWKPQPVPYFVSDAAPGTLSVADLQAAAVRSFATWAAVPTAAIDARFSGFTSARPFEDDGRSTIGFLSRPDLERVLGATTFTIDDTTGEIVESDIFINSRFDWSVAPGGEPGRYDLQSTLTHEVGHFLGLGHSALGETELRPGGGRRVIASGAVMFPIAFSPGSTADRTLQPDDVAGLADVYPATGFRDESGSVQGTVLLDGQPVVGAHVVTFDPATGALVGGFTSGDGGRFAISALRPGPKVVRVEPLDDADLESFFDPGTPIELGFRVTFSAQLIVVPRRGAAPSVEIRVTRK